jgi:hypothetical protein
MFTPKANPQRTARERHVAQPKVEGLEGRLLLYSTLGGQFAFGSRITYSFVPDGTSVGGTPSTLNQTLNSDGLTTSAWELAFQKAAAAWESAANINLVQVPDNGAALGGAGDQQGDPNFGDIRIAGVPLSSGVLAEAFLPPPFNGGSLAGDILMSTSQNWGSGGFDLETVAIHEIGHALGLDHSSLSSADMYASYTGVHQSLSSDDAAGIQSLWGTNQDSGSNTSLANATNITANLNSQGQYAFTNTIAFATDYDYYYVVAPANTTGTLNVTLQSTNLSSLTPKLTVFNAAKSAVASVQLATNTFGGTVSMSISVTAGQGYYIRVMAANTGPGSAGVYGLSINFGSGTMPAFQPPNTTVAATADQGSGTAAEVAPPASTGKGHGGHHHLVHKQSHLATDAPTLVSAGSPQQPSTIHGYGDYMMIGAYKPNADSAANLHSGRAGAHRTR